MKTFARALGVIIAGLSAHAAASGQPPALPTEASIRPFIDHDDWLGARERINRLIEAHLVAGSSLRPDPALDRLIGEELAFYSPTVARPLLQRAVNDPTTQDRGRYALLLAGANETIGDRATAEEIYRHLLAEGVNPGVHRRAAVALARLLLISRPREALDVAVEVISNDPPGADRWEAELVASRAARILGLGADAARYLDQASVHGWSAPVGDMAIARIALDRGVAAGLAGDRPTLIAMSALDSIRQNDTARQFISLLPECGQQGITADDFVILEIVPRGTRHPRLGLIYASRPQIAGVFFELVARTPLQDQPNRAISVMMRCGIAPRAGLPRTWGDPIVEWAADRGAYPILEVSEEGAENGLAKLTDRETRLGADSPFLIPILVQLLAGQGQWQTEPSPGDIERLLGYARRLNALLAAQGAPAHVRLPAALASTVLSAMSVQQSQQATIRALRQTLEASAAEPAITTEALLLMANFVPSDSTIAPGLKIALLTQTLQRMHAPGSAADARVRGLAVQLINLELSAGNESGAASLAREYGIGADLCTIAQTEPRYLGSEIRAEDYPADAIVGELFGSVALDFAVDVNGVPGNFRQVVSSPPFVFDAATAARAPTIRYEPAQFAGRPRACRGLSTRIGWQLP